MTSLLLSLLLISGLMAIKMQKCFCLQRKFLCVPIATLRLSLSIASFEILRVDHKFLVTMPVCAVLSLDVFRRGFGLCYLFTAYT